MVYKNFFLRSIVSFLFVLIYLIIFFYDFNYVFYLVFIIYCLLIYEIYFYFIRYKILLITYILVSFVFFVSINFNNDTIFSFNLYIFSIVTFDTFSYFFGKLFGKNQLIKISPNKTVEGLVGGFSISFILSILFSYYLDIKINLNLIYFLILIISTAFIGDVIESYFKRKNKLKNSSELIPGHGGVFDRFDSFLFSIIFYSVFSGLLI
tara:strand:- start:15 stop:638 length:624 start_codon:yes stop_codon:yes gene_type:complete